MIDELATDVRSLIEQAMGMPANSVRPANQDIPAGGQIDQMATVHLADCDDIAWSDTTYEDIIPVSPTQVNEVTQVAKQFVASINFYRGTVADSEGIAVYGSSAHDMASQLVQRLCRSVNIELMQTLGIGFVSATKARDLSALVDATWESRAQIDVTFMAINRDAFPINTVASAEVVVTVQAPDGTTQTRTIEVQP